MSNLQYLCGEIHRAVLDSALLDRAICVSRDLLLLEPEAFEAACLVSRKLSVPIVINDWEPNPRPFAVIDANGPRAQRPSP